MEYGIVLPHNEIGNDPGAIKAFAQGAEALGATHLLIYDHVMGADPNRPGGWKNRPYDKDVAFHEPFTTFAFIAAVTSKIEMMSAVLILPQRQTVLVGKQAAEVAILSNGRFRLGVGTGWNTVEYEALNEDFHTRGARQSEQVDLLRKLWGEDSFSYAGKWHTVTAASINPRPGQDDPDLVRRRRTGAAQTLRRTGRRLDSDSRPNTRSGRIAADDPLVSRGGRKIRGPASACRHRRSSAAAIPNAGNNTPASGATSVRRTLRWHHRTRASSA